MDVKSAFLYGKIEEEIYVCQPPGFEGPDFPDKVEKALYGYIKLLEPDDIIFGSTKKSLCTEFEKMMHQKFKMSSIGELAFFLGLQVKQKEDGIFISQDKYVTEILKKFGYTDVKTVSTPMETQKLFLKDKDGEHVDVHLYRSMIGSLMYLTFLRPAIMFAVCACARYQVNPKLSHLHVVQRIFRLVPSCFVIYDLELLSLSFDFVFSSEIFKSLSFRLDRLCRLAILCLDQHAHTLHHLESLLTISLDRLDIFEGRSCISEFVRKSLSLILKLS
ncbi:putative ribonuclease H-like domain-containing protein [Tanacetum coccineum]|uniref:Ribonuclease H-like domain-containing protein n=1 Tax=Tanacetum coccineum TaxID=301880 RepID=A0ABQ5AWB6_9ASTR